MLIRDFENKKLRDVYNTENGQIRWLRDNDLHLNLYNFRSIIPRKIKQYVRNWKAINLPYEDAIKKYEL
jgi:hypothetical protein